MNIQSDASEIYQSILDMLTETAISGDVANYLAHMDIPHTLTTANGTITLESEAGLRQAFDAARSTLCRNALNGVTRVCLSAEFTAPRMIEGQHKTWLTTDETQIRQCYEGRLTLREVDGLWKVSASEYGSPEKTLPDDVIDEMSRSIRPQETP